MKRVRFARVVGYVLAFSIATVIAASAQNFAAENFDFADGGNPRGPLVQGLNGYLYGTTVDGGANFNCASQVGGCGTVFQLAANGKLSAFYSFCSQPNCTDGDVPAVGVILGADGNFYGTTLGGGAYGVANPRSGTVFRITPGGKLTTLYSFCSQVNIYGVCLDGASPYGLLQATDGNLYGITSTGGNGDPNNQACYNPDGALYGCGTIFKITASGKLTTLYTFCLNLNQGGFCPDGEAPGEALVEGTDGNFYGTTPTGGANPCLAFGCGTVFKITPSGAFTTIYSFCPDQLSCVDGETPGMLMRAADGNLYGVATQGGPLGGGSVFQISLTGALTPLYGFCNTSNGACPDGSVPISLIQANDGNFYGTTGSGGATCSDNGFYGCGTIFRLTPHAVITTLHSFCQNLCYDGIGATGLVQATNGALLGLAGEGGADHGCSGGCGTVYGLTAGLKPLVEANPNFGKTGQTIAILGSNLTSSASVTFNGTAAKFSVVSGTELRATVPTGATTGTIQVKTSKATLLSNLPFEVQ
ncbi:MAG: choice-of-anchor tandem repeat GloVer-containing protein [Candidatus Sulfotelmatobacter sp.]